MAGRPELGGSCPCPQPGEQEGGGCWVPTVRHVGTEGRMGEPVNFVGRSGRSDELCHAWPLMPGRYASARDHLKGD